MLITLTKRPIPKPAGCSTAETMSDKDHAKSGEEWRTFIDRTIGDILIEAETNTAKLNLLRLFYLDETRPVIPFELYNSAKNPQIRLNVKIAVCCVLSGPCLSNLGRYDQPLSGTPLGPLGRYDLPGVLDRLWLKLLSLLKAQAQFDQHSLYSELLPLRYQLDQIAASPGFFTLAPEPLYELLREFFIPESTLAHGEMTKPVVRCPLTREKARSHLAKTYGDHYTDYDWSREAPGLLTTCLELPYDGGFL
jgi:hypothetical protein